MRSPSGNGTLLLQFFTGPLLPSLKIREPSLLSDLAACRCVVTNSGAARPTVEFTLPDLFDVLWRQGSAAGLALHHSSSWERDFGQFCEALFNPALDADLRHHGYTIELVTGMKGLLQNRYLLTPI